MRGRRWAGRRWTAPTRSPGSWPGRSAAIRWRNAIWAGRSARSSIRATNRRRCGGRAMSDGVLYIGHKRYSSWSMRGWLAVRLAELDVDVELLRFSRPGPTPAIGSRSPSHLVPYLEHHGARVWESLAICEYCAE